MHHQVIYNVRDWRTLRDQWGGLLEVSRANQLFMTWEWLDSWLGAHADIEDLFVICVRDDEGRLAGVAPFYKAAYRLFRVVPCRALRLIGDVDSGAEYQMWVTRTADEDAVCAEIAQALHSLRSEWDLLWIPNTSSWTGIHEPVMRALASRGLAVRTRSRGFSSIPLPPDFESFLAGMTTNRRQQVRRTTKKILSKPGVTVQQVTRPEELGPALQALFLLHGKRWRAAGIEGVFDRNPRERAFYERFVPEALARGWLAMFVLLDGAEPKAVQIGYIYNNTLLQLQDGFDPEYEPHVGNALRAWVIKHCIERGVTEYDFLGGHSEHKRRWQAVERSGADILGLSPTLRGRVLQAGIWPTGRYLRPARATGTALPQDGRMEEPA